MSEEVTPVEETPSAEQAHGGPGLFAWAALAVIAAGLGFAAPFVLPLVNQDSSGDAAASGPPSAGIPQEVAFVPFGEVIVNLDEGRLNRYLRLSISLQVEKASEEQVTKLLEQRQAVLRNWLLSHVSDKTMDEIRGAAGQNRLRREIQDQFNTVLFPDGYDRIYDVLFEEFNVQ